MSQLEDNQLIYTFFNNLFFLKWVPGNEAGAIELNITSDCNYKCEYCYLYKNGDKLYPKEFRSPKLIKDNLKILIDWIIENNYYITRLDIFSGEFFSGQLGLDILNIIYETNLKKKYCSYIVIPSNCSFIKNKEYTKKVEEVFKKLKDIGIDVCISCSIDGRPIDELSRASKIDIKREDEYYNDLFTFGKKYKFGYHPMIGRTFLNHYKENYDWWIEQIQKYYDKSDWKNQKPMMLEIRNDDWDEEILKKYSDFLRYCAKKDLAELHNDNKEEMAHKLFYTSKNKIPSINDNLKLPFVEPRMTCAIQFYPCVRLGDLAFNPCHRTSYPGLNYGKFIVKNNKIVGMESWNIPLAVKIYSLNPIVSHPKCSVCKIKNICLKGCLGSQLESTGELFSPIDSVCNLFYTKMDTLYDIYNELGFIDIVMNDKDLSYDEKQNISYRLDIMRSIKK